jgi:D-sedoheptulose 7-phosphate isomerase
MESALFDYFQRAIDLKQQLAENYTASLVSAAQMMTSALVADGKIVVCGDADTDFIAEAFRRQLTYRYEIERPGLPCIRLDADQANEHQINQMRTLTSAGDVLLILATQNSNETMISLTRLAAERSLGLVLVCRQSQNQLRQSIGSDNINFSFGEMSKAHLLENYLSISLTLAALIDHQLFGSEL